MVSTGVRVLFDEDVGLANYSTIADFDHDMVVFKCLGAGEDATLELRDVAENCLDRANILRDVLSYPCTIRATVSECSDYTRLFVEHSVMEIYRGYVYAAINNVRIRAENGGK